MTICSVCHNDFFSKIIRRTKTFNSKDHGNGKMKIKQFRRWACAAAAWFNYYTILHVAAPEAERWKMIMLLLLLFNSSQMFKISLLYNNIIRNNLGDWMRNRIVIPINTSPLVLLYTLYDYVKAPSQCRTNDQVERNRNVIISSKVWKMF